MFSFPHRLCVVGLLFCLFVICLRGGFTWFWICLPRLCFGLLHCCRLTRLCGWFLRVCHASIVWQDFIFLFRVCVGRLHVCIGSVLSVWFADYYCVFLFGCCIFVLVVLFVCLFFVVAIFHLCIVFSVFVVIVCWAFAACFYFCSACVVVVWLNIFATFV